MRKILKKLKKFRKKPAIFASGHQSHKERNSIILDFLPDKKSWILDIGSNTGETANFLAENSHVAIGLEKMEAEYRTSLRHANRSAGFLCTDVTGDFILSGPRWDAILLLSVLHRIYAFGGDEAMKAVLFASGQKADVLFVEGATRHARYTSNGCEAPDFEDLNLEAASQWHHKIFNDVLGPAWVVDLEKSLRCSDKEPYRILYRLSRKSET